MVKISEYTPQDASKSFKPGVKPSKPIVVFGSPDKKTQTNSQPNNDNETQNLNIDEWNYFNQPLDSHTENSSNDEKSNTTEPEMDASQVIIDEDEVPL